MRFLGKMDTTTSPFHTPTLQPTPHIWLPSTGHEAHP